MLFRYKEYALNVYNALNNSDYDDLESIQIFNLDSTVVLSVRNDASFILNGRICVYEHQSKANPNMPLRNLLYIADLYRNYIKENKIDIFSSTLKKIPTPQFVVIYNGLQEFPEEKEYCLSDAFEIQEDNPQLELKTKVYNLNSGYNETLLKASFVLEGYCFFVERVRYYLKEHELDEAIDMAISDCIQTNHLTSFFEENKDEVKRMTKLDFTIEKRLELTGEEKYIEGHKDGVQEGIKEGETKLAKLIVMLQNDTSEILKVSTDKSYREEMYKKYNIK